RPLRCARSRALVQRPARAQPRRRAQPVALQHPHPPHALIRVDGLDDTLRPSTARYARAQDEEYCSCHKQSNLILSSAAATPRRVSKDARARAARSKSGKANPQTVVPWAFAGTPEIEKMSPRTSAHPPPPLR